MNVEDDEAGRLAGFRARFGRGYDIGKESTPGSDSETPSMETEREKAKAKAATRPLAGKEIELDANGFGPEEDANLLDLISSYGRAEEARGKRKAGGK